MFWMIIIIIVVLCLIGFLSSKASDIAQDKGYDKKTWFHMCFWLGPISFILIAAMPDLKLRTKQDETISQLKQLIEQAKNDKTSSLLSELVDYTKANQAAQAAQTIQPVQAAPSQETHTSSAQTTMRRRGPVAPISQED